MLRPIFLAMLLGAASTAWAQARPPEGMVSDPCEGLTVPVPEAVIAYLRKLAVLSQGAAPPVPPVEFAAYRTANLEARKSDWPDLCHYRADNERRRAGPASARRIVFMGDSITEIWGIDDPAFFSDDIVNRGISGQTTPQMLLRFQADVVALKPVAVHIMAGTNDIAGNTGPTGAEDYKNNIKAMVALAKAGGIKVILASIPPAGRFAWKPTIKPVPQIAELNAWLASYAKAEKLSFLDYHPALAAPDGALRPDLTFDGVHPNHAGYRAMAPLARQAIGVR